MLLLNDFKIYLKVAFSTRVLTSGLHQVTLQVEKATSERLPKASHERSKAK